MDKWYCDIHKTWFTNVCIACVDLIFHSTQQEISNEMMGIGLIEHTDANYLWDDTYSFIESL